MYPRAKPPTPVRQSVDRNAKTRLNLPIHDVVPDPTSKPTPRPATRTKERCRKCDQRLARQEILHS